MTEKRLDYNTAWDLAHITHEDRSNGASVRRTEAILRGEVTPDELQSKSEVYNEANDIALMLASHTLEQHGCLPPIVKKPLDQYSDDQIEKAVGMMKRNGEFRDDSAADRLEADFFAPSIKVSVKRGFFRRK